MTVRQDGPGRYSGDEFPPFIPLTSAFNSTFNDTARGLFYKFDRLSQTWLEAPAVETGAFNVMSYGAKGDGEQDDTGPIQAAIDFVDKAGGGTVYFPECAGYRISSTLVVNTSSTFKTINLVGAGMLATRLLWYGATNLPALRINGLKQYIFEGFLVENKVAKGTTVGILVQRDSGTGTNSGSCVWRNIKLKAFATGAQVGNVGITQAGSEMHFDHISLEGNDIGCQIQDSNSLNFLFSMLEIGANGIGVQVLQGGVVAIVGGSASGQTTSDFDFQPGGSYSISSFRSETANRFLTGGNTSTGTAMYLSGNTVKAITNGDGLGVRVGSGPIVMVGNDFLCKVACSGTSTASVVAIGNAIADPNTVDFATLGGTGGQYTFFGNKEVSTANVNVGPLPNEAGYLASGVKVPSFKLDSTGLLNTKASVAGGSGFRLPHGTAPTSPVNGDMWTTTAGLFVQVNGVTKTVTLT